MRNRGNRDKTGLEGNTPAEKIAPVSTSPNPVTHRHRGPRPRRRSQLNQRLERITGGRSIASRIRRSRDRLAADGVGNPIQIIDGFNRGSLVKEVDQDEARLTAIPCLFAVRRGCAQVACPAGRGVRRAHVAGVRVLDVEDARVQEVVHQRE